MIYSRQRNPSPVTAEGKHIFTSSWHQDETAGAVRSHARRVSGSGSCSDEMFVSGRASCGYRSATPPSSELLLLLHAALVASRSTCHHACVWSSMNKTTSEQQTRACVTRLCVFLQQKPVLNCRPDQRAEVDGLRHLLLSHISDGVNY